MRRGFTLIELIIVIVISSMIGLFTFAFLYNSIQAYRLMRTQSQLYQEGSYALERLTRELRDASHGFNVIGGISFFRAHPTPFDSNLTVRYYLSGSSLFRCSDTGSVGMCLTNPDSSPTNKLLSSNVSTFVVQHNTNSEPCNVSAPANCQDDSFSIILGLTKDGQTFTMSTTVTPRNYCSNGATGTTCAGQDYSNRSFNGDYRDVVN